MVPKLYTLTAVARKLGRDYRGVRDYDSKRVEPVAIVVVGGRERRLYRLEQFRPTPL